MELLTRLEEAILIAVLRLGDEAYGVSVNREVSRIFCKTYTLGALYFALDRLVRREYLGKMEGDPTPQRGGRSKTYYRVTPEGRSALESVREYQENLWRAVADLRPVE
jgi:DNA-binding PadR family transcriptional regulator